MENINIDNSKINCNTDHYLEILKTKINSIINHSYEETIRNLKLKMIYIIGKIKLLN